MSKTKELLKEVVSAMTSEQVELFNEECKKRNLTMDWEKLPLAQSLAPIRESTPARKGQTSEQLTEANREKQYNAYLKSGFTEAEARGASGFTPKIA